MDFFQIKKDFDTAKLFDINRSRIPEFEVVESRKTFPEKKVKANALTEFSEDGVSFPKFQISKTKDLLHDYGIPNTKATFSNEHRYMYPKQTKDEAIINQMQTDSGTPNAFNELQRHYATGQPLEAIKAEDIEEDEAFVDGIKTLNRLLANGRMDEKDAEKYMKKIETIRKNRLDIKPIIAKNARKAAEEKAEKEVLTEVKKKAGKQAAAAARTKEKAEADAKADAAADAKTDAAADAKAEALAAAKAKASSFAAKATIARAEKKAKARAEARAAEAKAEADAKAAADALLTMRTAEKLKDLESSVQKGLSSAKKSKAAREASRARRTDEKDEGDAKAAADALLSMKTAEMDADELKAARKKHKEIMEKSKDSVAKSKTLLAKEETDEKAQPKDDEEKKEEKQKKERKKRDADSINADRIALQNSLRDYYVLYGKEEHPELFLPNAALVKLRTEITRVKKALHARIQSGLAEI